MEIIPVINWVCACIKTSVEDDNFLREGSGCVNLMIFIWEFLRFVLTEKALFQVILGLLLLSISVCRLRERVFMSKSVYVRVVHDRIIEICSSLCDRTTALISHWD